MPATPRTPRAYDPASAVCTCVRIHACSQKTRGQGQGLRQGLVGVLRAEALVQQLAVLCALGQRVAGLRQCSKGGPRGPAAGAAPRRQAAAPGTALQEARVWAGAGWIELWLRQAVLVTATTACSRAKTPHKGPPASLRSCSTWWPRSRVWILAIRP